MGTIENTFLHKHQEIDSTKWLNHFSKIFKNGVVSGLLTTINGSDGDLSSGSAWIDGTHVIIPTTASAFDFSSTLSVGTDKIYYLYLTLVNTGLEDLAPTPVFGFQESSTMPASSIQIGKLVVPLNTVTLTQTMLFDDYLNKELSDKQAMEQQALLNRLLATFNGTILESFDALVVEDTGVLSMTLEQSGGGDLTMVFSDGFTVLDCTPIQTVVLTAGTDTNPTSNYVYIPVDTKVLTVSTTQWPTTIEHIKVSYFYLQSASGVATNFELINQNWNDHATNTVNQGHMTHISQAMRLTTDGAHWHSGITPSIDILAGTPSVVYFSTTAGIVYQLHAHSYQGFDSSLLGDNRIHVVNDSVTPFDTIYDLGDIDTDAVGGSLDGRYFNLTFWGVANKAGHALGNVMVNLPNGSYNRSEDAIQDISGHDVFDIPRQFKEDSSTGFLIGKYTLRRQVSGLITFQHFVDLRGTAPGTTVGGGGIADLTEFPDNQFLVHDDVDSTKIMDIQASGISPGTTRTMSVPDESGVWVLDTATQTLTNKTLTTPVIGDFTNAEHTHESDVPGSGGEVSAKDITIFTIEPATVWGLGRALGYFFAPGVFEGLEVSDNGDGTVDISSGFIIIKDSTLPTAGMYSTDIPTLTNIVMNTDSENWIYVEWNAGAPQIVLDTSRRFDTNTNVLLAYIYRNSTTELHINPYVRFTHEDAQKNMAAKDVLIKGFEWEQGATVTEVGTRNIAITAGHFWYCFHHLIIPAIDTSGIDTFESYYFDGVDWVKTLGETQIDNLQYNDVGIGLATLNNNQYGVHWVFITPAHHVEIVYGVDSYTEQEAIEVGLPDLPPAFPDTTILVAKIIIGKGSATFHSILSPFTETFATATSGLFNVVEDTTPELGGDLLTHDKRIIYGPTDLDDQMGCGIIITAQVDTNAQGIGAPLSLGTDGNYDTTNASGTGTIMPCRGLALTSGTDTDEEILLDGFYRDDTAFSGWIPNEYVYVNNTTGTLINSSSGFISGDKIQKVGHIESAGILRVKISDTIITKL